MTRGTRSLLFPMVALGLACAGPLREPQVQPAPAPPPETVSDGRPAMGTILQIELVGADPAWLRQELDALYAEVEALESVLSTWRPGSDLSRLNQGAGGASVRVAPPALELLRLSASFWRETGGRFDVTVGPLVQLWRAAAERGRLPSASELAAARARVGVGQLSFRVDGSVALLDQGASVDVGGIAKGYALDVLARKLRADGVDDALLDFGQSSVWALGAPPGARGWRLVARGVDGGALGTLTLRDQALSVSGSLGQSAEIEGRRVGHVIDPRSGEPLSRPLQALVVARDAARAEAWSKAFLIDGETSGDELARAARGCEALVAGPVGIAYRTPGFDQATSFELLKLAEAAADGD